MDERHNLQALTETGSWSLSEEGSGRISSSGAHSAWAKRPANESLWKTMADYHDLVDRGRREIYRIESWGVRPRLRPPGSNSGQGWQAVEGRRSIRGDLRQGHAVRRGRGGRDRRLHQPQDPGVRTGARRPHHSATMCGASLLGTNRLWRRWTRFGLGSH